MKKKIIIPLSIIVLVFLVANIVTYAYSNENLFEFFFITTPIMPPSVVPNVPKNNPKIVVFKIFSTIKTP